MYKAKTIQKESRMDDEITPRPHVRNAYDSSNSILPQPEKNVNRFEQTRKAFSDFIENNPEYKSPQTRSPRDAKSGGKGGKKLDKNSGSDGSGR